MKIISLPDGRELKYELTRKRVKNINMRVSSNGIVQVSANNRLTIENIEAILAERADYFLNAVKQLQEREKRMGISDDGMRWLGKEYPIRIIRNSSERVALEENELRVFTNHPENFKLMLEDWATDQFCELMRELNEEVRSALNSRGLYPPPTTITVKEMKTRWGSCSYNRARISINVQLMSYPRETVLSVLWHEYAHYWHHDHSERFYAFLQQHFPEYRKWNDLLK